MKTELVKVCNATYVHERVPIDQSFLHFNQLNIVVAKCKPVVKDITIRGLPRLSVAKLADNILDRVNFMPAVSSIDYDVLSTSVGRLYNTYDLSTLRHLLLLFMIKRLCLFIPEFLPLILLILLASDDL